MSTKLWLFLSAKMNVKSSVQIVVIKMFCPMLHSLSPGTLLDLFLGLLRHSRLKISDKKIYKIHKDIKLYV